MAELKKIIVDGVEYTLPRGGASNVSEEAVTLSASSWSEIGDVAPFTVQQSVALTQTWDDVNIAMYIQSFNGIADGIVLNSVAYSEEDRCYVGVFYAVSVPTTDVTVVLISVGSEGSSGSEYLVECETLPTTINKNKIYRVSREITLGEFNDIYLYAPAFKDIFGKETLSFREFMSLSGEPTFAFNYILVDSLPDYDSFVNGEVTVYDKISNKIIDATMLTKQMHVFISEETSDAYMIHDSFASVSTLFGTQFAGEPLPCKGVVTSVSEITETGLYLMYYEGDRYIAYNVINGSGIGPYLLDNAILAELGIAGGYSDVPFFTEPVMDHILFDSTQSTDEGIYDLATGNFRAYSTMGAESIPTVIAIDINDYSAYVNTAYSELSRIDDMFGYDSKGVVDSLDEMTEEGYYILKRNNSASGEGTDNIETSIHVPYSGEYLDVTVEYPKGTINSTYRDPIQATITPSEEVQELNSTSTSYIDKITVEAVQTEEKTVTPTESAQTVTPTDGSYIKKVTVEAISAITTTVKSTTQLQEITPDSGTYFKKITVEPASADIEITSVSVNPSNTTQTITAPEGVCYNEITVEAVPTEEKTVTPTEEVQEVIPTDGYYIKKVTVNAINTSTATVQSIEKSQTITPSSGTYFNKIIVAPSPKVRSTSVTSSERNQTITAPEDTCYNKVEVIYGTKSNRTNFDRFYENSSSTPTGIRLIDTSNATTMSRMFYDCFLITTIPLLDTRNVTDMSSMFSGCTKLTTVPPLSTSNVTTMHNMFKNCTNLTTIPLLDTSNVTDISSMFSNCTNLTTIPLLDTSNATNMGSMFYNCYSLTSIPALNTSNATNMGSMFDHCTNLTSIPLLDTSNVTNIGSMFSGCTKLTTVPLLDTSNVTRTSYMFSDCTNLTTVPLLSTSNVTEMYGMFRNCTNLTTIPLLDTSKVTGIGDMFSGCTNLTTIPLLDTSNVTNIDSMFYDCTNLTTIPLLDTSNVTDMSHMFSGCTKLTTVPLLDTSKVTRTSFMFYGCTSLKSILMTGMKVSFDISASTQFEQADLVTILNNLATVTTRTTLTMGSTNLAKLTDEDKAIATNKGWTLA